MSLVYSLLDAHFRWYLVHLIALIDFKTLTRHEITTKLSECLRAILVVSFAKSSGYSQFINRDICMEKSAVLPDGPEVQLSILLSISDLIRYALKQIFDIHVALICQIYHKRLHFTDPQLD